MSMIENDRLRSLEEFANVSPVEKLPATTGQAFAAPVERVFGAQPVAVKRDEEVILKKIRVLAAAAGDDFYYRFPVKKKVKNEATGKDEWVQDYIEGPTIKCANAVARLFGNCDTDVRVFDTGGHWLFYARFMDLETGYCLTRPFQQRKNQGSMRGDSGRAEDIAFQIGASKAIRNVTTNALETFTTFAWQEAKASIIEKVGKRLDYYRDRVIERLKEMNVDLHRVEHVRGRPAKDWLAPDVAKIIAELQAIGDGMATIDETFPPKEEPKADAGAKLDQFAQDHDPKTGEVKDETAVNQQQASQPDAKSSPPSGASGATEGGAETGDVGNVPNNASAPSSENTPSNGEPKTDADYKAYATKWIGEQTNPEERKARWAREKVMRNKANVTPETRDELEALVKRKA